MNNKYIKKSVEIEAIQWNGINLSEIQEFGKGNLDIDIYNNGVTPPLVTIEIKTLEGVMKLNEDDYLIKGIKGEYYPCKPDIFELTYEKVYTLEEVKKEWEELGYSWEEDVYCIRLTNLKEDKVITFGFASKSYYCKCIKGYVHRSISFQEHQLLTKTFKALGWI